MIRSMTGYGKSEAILENGKLTIEFRSVNSKGADITIKSSLMPKDKDIEVRKRIADRLCRGTIDMFITWEPSAVQSSRRINVALAKEYYAQLSEIAAATGTSPVTLSDIMKMPDLLESGHTDIITAENWPAVSDAVDRALDAIDAYREDEGRSLYRDVTSRVKLILALYDEVEGFEGERISAVRERVLKAAEDLKIKLDADRFEQEMVFYLEKLDINEEKVRLRQHCKYFMDTIDSEPYPGKKLGFIIQEMGREINTTGSKANHAGIQKCVVRMKDELEKIREQSMNIL